MITVMKYYPYMTKEFVSTDHIEVLAALGLEHYFQSVTSDGIEKGIVYR